jgi:N-acetylglucosamine malate deacetylase 1
MKKILVIAPHPDDETLGCGGALLKHASMKDKIHWLLITNITEENGWEVDKVNQRQKEINKVSKMYGFNSLTKLDFPTMMLDTIPMSELVNEISNVISRIKPDFIYLNYQNDIHTDHQVVFKAVMSSVKSFRHPYIQRILNYETLSETEFAPPSKENIAFQPNVFVDITKFFDKKCEIMMIYDGEVMSPPYPRSLDSIKALAKYRGSRIGVKYAEAFSLLYEKI